MVSEILSSKYEVLSNNPINSLYLTKTGIKPNVIEKFSPYFFTVSEIDSGLTKLIFPFLSLVNHENYIGSECYSFKNKFYQWKYKSRKNESVWSAMLCDNDFLVKDIFLFHNPIEALSFYQLYQNSISFKYSLFISFPGSVNKIQLEHLFEIYPDVKYHTCFNNSRGRLLDVFVFLELSGKQYSIFKNAEENHYSITVNRKHFNVPVDQLSIQKVKEHSGLRPRIRTHKVGKTSVEGTFNELLTKF